MLGIDDCSHAIKNGRARQSIPDYAVWQTTSKLALAARIEWFGIIRHSA